MTNLQQKLETFAKALDEMLQEHETQAIRIHQQQGAIMMLRVLLAEAAKEQAEATVATPAQRGIETAPGTG